LKRSSHESGDSPSSSSPSKKPPIYHNAHKLYWEQELAKRQRIAAMGGGNSSPSDLPPTLKPQVPVGHNLLTVSQPESGTSKSNSSSGNSSLICRFPNPNYQQQQPPVLMPFTAHQPVVEMEPSPSPPPLPPLPEDPKEWSINQVISYLSNLDSSLGPHVQLFRSHEIDGNALLLLTTDMMMKYMDMKLGPALKIANIVNMIQGKKFQPIPK
jgi:hypothetical protein